MTTHDSSTVGTDPDRSHTECRRAVRRTGAVNTRTLVLLVGLGLALFALWYDKKVARPAVEAAYNTIETYNDEVNTSAGRVYLTEKEIQQKLNREPSKSYSDGDYFVEEYRWVSGLPFRSHTYYAVYGAGTPLVFLKHFKYELPPDELKAEGLMVSAGFPAGEGPQGEASTENQAQAGSQDAAAPGEPAADVPSVDAPARAAAQEKDAADEKAAGDAADKAPGDAAPATESPADSAAPK